VTLLLRLKQARWSNPAGHTSLGSLNPNEFANRDLAKAKTTKVSGYERGQEGATSQPMQFVGSPPPI
jgi:hypothetical protein